MMDSLLQRFSGMSEEIATQWIIQYHDLPVDTLIYIIQEFYSLNNSYSVLDSSEESSIWESRSSSTSMVEGSIPTHESSKSVVSSKASNQSNAQSRKQSQTQSRKQSQRATAHIHRKPNPNPIPFQHQDLSHLASLQNSRSRLLSIKTIDSTYHVKVLTNSINKIQDSVLPQRKNEGFLLDLHYFDAEGAAKCLTRSLQWCHQNEVDFIRIITGKGSLKLFNLVWEFCEGEPTIKFKVDRNTHSFQVWIKKR
ncbi:hypothetical protein P9112_003601 [Eukaryota sp. TZLM1-RC]